MQDSLFPMPTSSIGPPSSSCSDLVLLFFSRQALPIIGGAFVPISLSPFQATNVTGSQPPQVLNTKAHIGAEQDLFVC